MRVESRETGDQWFRFERLDVWKKAVDFSASVYRMTKAFPREEVFGITSQLRRASVSVVANIAEGTGRTSSKDQARFYEIAYGSLMEIAAILFVARTQEFVTEAQLAEARTVILEMCRMLTGLKRTTLGS